jgi:hypothetical protein
MWHRKHTYMRLDGSSKISERRDMVADFQSRSVIKDKPRKIGDCMVHRSVTSDCQFLICVFPFTEKTSLCFC